MTGNRFVTSRAELAWSHLPGLPDAGPHPLAVLVDRPEPALAAVREHARSGREMLVLARTRADTHLVTELRADGFAVLDTGLDPDAVLWPTVSRAQVAGRVWLLTSGSTGRPRRIGHTLESLTTVPAGQEPRMWLCPYSPGTYAWWQLVTLGLRSAGQDLLLLGSGELGDWPRLAARHNVTAASGTPTFWRQTLHGDATALAAVPLRQVSLGGEPVDQPVLDRLRELFPRARLTWIYASSEVGAAIVVHDGHAGFPLHWVGRRVPGRPTVDVDGDELVITSPHHGVGQDGPVHTGDRVEVRGDRVLITGRVDTDEINVGGTKVSAGLVRSTLLEHPGVAWTRVHARRAPLVGNLVAAEVVATRQGRPDEAELARWCSSRLPEHAVPRRFRFLDRIPTKESLKSDV